MSVRVCEFASSWVLQQGSFLLGVIGLPNRGARRGAAVSPEAQPLVAISNGAARFSLLSHAMLCLIECATIADLDSAPSNENLSGHVFQKLRTRPSVSKKQ